MNNEQPNNLNNFPQENSPSVEPAGMPVNDLGSVEKVPNPTPQEPAPSFGAPIMEPPIVPNPTSQTTEPKKKKGINKGLLIAIIAILVVMIAVGGYAVYLFFGVSPKSVHDKVIDDLFASTYEFANQLAINNKDIKTFKQHAELSFDTNIDEISMLNDYSLKTDLQEDLVENYVNYKYSFLEKNKNLLETNIYQLNDKLYLDSKQLYDQVIELGNIGINLSTSSLFDAEDITYLLDTLKKGIKDSFAKGKFTRNLETVKLNGKSIKAFNNSYVIDEAGYYSMLRSILSTFKDDEKSLQIIADFVNNIESSTLVDSMMTVNTMEDTQRKEITVDDVKKSLDSLIAELENTELSDPTAKIYFNVYTNMITNQPIGIKLISKNGEESTDLLEYYEEEKNSSLKIYTDYKKTSSFELNTKDTNAEFKFINEGETILTGTLENTDTKSELIVNIHSQNEQIIPDITLGMRAEVVDDTTKMQIKVAFDQDGKTNEIAVNMNFKTTFDEDLTKPDVSNAIPTENVDAELFTNNLMTALEDSNLYSIISEYLEPSYGLEDYEDDIIYSEHCDEASNCKCSGLSCTCHYLNDDFEYEDIVCPSPNI